MNIVGPKNPSNVDKLESMIQGTAAEIMHIDSMSNCCNANVKVSNSNKGNLVRKVSIMDSLSQV